MMREVEDLASVRATCAIAMPMLAYLLFKFDVSYGECQTARATMINNQYKIEIGEKFWNSLNHSERAFLLFHEVMHIFLLHFGRMKDCNYNPILWNIATDYFINYTLKGYSVDVNTKRQMQDQRIVKYLSMPRIGLYESKFIGMSADEIYDELLKDADSYSEDDLFDEIGDSWSTEEQESQLRRDITSAVVVGGSMGSGIGDTEAGILRTLADIVKPKINWKDFLKTEVDRNSFQRYTYNKYNKLSGTILFPKRVGEFVRVVFGVDTSGSMSEEELRIALGGIYEILNQYEEWELILITCDVKAHTLGHYKSENGDTFENINKTFIGGGGTDMTAIVDEANRLFLDEGIDVCVIYTDGDIPKIKAPILCETIFLITPSGTMFRQDNTKTVRIEV
jgi:predicted metal-dependent peptidase